MTHIVVILNSERRVSYSTTNILQNILKKDMNLSDALFETATLVVHDSRDWDFSYVGLLLLDASGDRYY